MTTNVTRQFRSRERNVHTFVPGNESAWERNVPVPEGFAEKGLE